MHLSAKIEQMYRTARTESKVILRKLQGQQVKHEGVYSSFVGLHFYGTSSTAQNRFPSTLLGLVEITIPLATGLQKIETQWMQIFYTNAFVAFIMCSVNSQEYMMS